MHPINEREGFSNKLFWIVASKRSAIIVIEPTRLYNPSSTIIQLYNHSLFYYIFNNLIVIS